jgi:hypothetical protein
MLRMPELPELEHKLAELIGEVAQEVKHRRLDSQAEEGLEPGRHSITGRAWVAVLFVGISAVFLKWLATEIRDTVPLFLFGVIGLRLIIAGALWVPLTAVARVRVLPLAAGIAVQAAEILVESLEAVLHIRQPGQNVLPSAAIAGGLVWWFTRSSRSAAWTLVAFQCSAIAWDAVQVTAPAMWEFALLPFDIPYAMAFSIVAELGCRVVSIVLVLRGQREGEQLAAALEG